MEKLAIKSTQIEDIFGFSIFYKLKNKSFFCLPLPKTPKSFFPMYYLLKMSCLWGMQSGAISCSVCFENGAQWFLMRVCVCVCVRMRVFMLQCVGININ